MTDVHEITETLGKPKSEMPFYFDDNYFRIMNIVRHLGLRLGRSSTKEHFISCGHAFERLSETYSQVDLQHRTGSEVSKYSAYSLESLDSQKLRIAKEIKDFPNLSPSQADSNWIGLFKWGEPAASADNEELIEAGTADYYGTELQARFFYQNARNLGLVSLSVGYGIRRNLRTPGYKPNAVLSLQYQEPNEQNSSSILAMHGLDERQEADILHLFAELAGMPDAA